ncbi:hypothetical protein EB118_05850 [bacterium]|nr:hypothetical protein [bacterium]NDD82905.1 hypothetical protein [bacterium]NDG29605.1 hypothetical protein [bacterium]
MASISVTYTPYYQGCHRIGYKESTSLADYCIYIDSSESVIGEPKTVVIEINTPEEEACAHVENYQCQDGIDIVGYVQACCSAVDDEESKIPFSFSAETLACNSYEVECLGSGIFTIEVTNPGSGYTVAPLVTITGGSGTGASAEALINAGSVIVVQITSGLCGDGYSFTNPSTVTIAPPDTPGVQATAQISLLRPCSDGCGGDNSIRVVGCNAPGINRVVTPTPDTSYYLCSQVAPNISLTGLYTRVNKIDQTACCSCKYYSIENMGESVVEYFYIDCAGTYQNQISLLPGQTDTICAKENSVHSEYSSETEILLISDTCP